MRHKKPWSRALCIAAFTLSGVGLSATGGQAFWGSAKARFARKNGAMKTITRSLFSTIYILKKHLPKLVPHGGAVPLTKKSCAIRL
jgi:hypothetical protein